jgi:hypothetical protein
MKLGNSGAFCLYLWRVASAPGARYFAKNFYVAQALCAALVKDGYLVKAIRLEADVEYRMTGGKLVPVAAHSQNCSVKRRPNGLVAGAILNVNLRCGIVDETSG